LSTLLLSSGASSIGRILRESLRAAIASGLYGAAKETAAA
jgi:hypothetical protein